MTQSTITKIESTADQDIYVKPITEFQLGDFNVQITPSVHNNLIVEVNHVDSGYLDWHDIGVCDTVTNALTCAVEFIERGKFIEYKGSLIRVCKLDITPDGELTTWSGDLFGADLQNYGNWHDTDPEYCWKELYAIADRIDAEFDSEIDRAT
ncbi:hypothetical protein K9N68_33780 [Kovacikia minuta CCNUW1]|uniref:hypothetical protein n=1 Tax=Kovacikia minuta TaxID=2931930 RepID=UPI001CC9B049|nr:hypothetical protein [Kovacikia minuta]UBF26414.1 hypothetical protein K9N68_33780 [Kovacikia minuta CCNUW1]